MRRRRTVAALAFALAVGACGGGGEGDTPATTDGDLITDLEGPVAGFGGAIKRANDVADAANDRISDLESQINNELGDRP